MDKARFSRNVFKACVNEIVAQCKDKLRTGKVKACKWGEKDAVVKIPGGCFLVRQIPFMNSLGGIYYIDDLATFEICFYKKGNVRKFLEKKYERRIDSYEYYYECNAKGYYTWSFLDVIEDLTDWIFSIFYHKRNK